MQHQLLQVLQQRAAGAVDDALRKTGRARGVHDVERMVERQADWRLGRLGGWTVRPGEPLDPRLTPRSIPLETPSRRFAAEIRDHHDPLRSPGRPASTARSRPARSMALPGMAVLSAANQHLGTDLSEAVQDRPVAEVRGATTTRPRQDSRSPAWRSRSRAGWAGSRRPGPPPRRRRAGGPPRSGATSRAQLGEAQGALPPASFQNTSASRGRRRAGAGFRRS